MPDWRITYQGRSTEVKDGKLETTLRTLYSNGVDEFAVEVVTLDPGLYVPELQRHDEAPDTIPEEWTK